MVSTISPHSHAIREAVRRGWSLAWVEDDDGDHSYLDLDCSKDANGNPPPPVQTCEGLILYDAEGRTLDSLWCIDDSTDEHRQWQ